MHLTVKYLLLPSSVIMISVTLGALLVCLQWTRKAGVWLTVFAFTCYALFSAGPIAFLLLGNLEYQVPPATPSERAGVRTMVVLAAYGEPDLGIPLSSRISDGTAFRLLEAISLFQSSPEATIIVSGGGEVPAIMRDVLISVGIPREHIQVDSESASTFESATHLISRLGKMPFLLVTSAGHMPRAMGVFQKAGMIPRSVPTHFISKRNWLAVQYLPSPVHLVYSDLAVSEYAAFLWYRLRGWL